MIAAAPTTKISISTSAVARPRRRCAGFTYVEMMVVCTMTTALAMLLSSLWSGLGRPMADAMASAQIAQEANLAAAALARDFGGSLADSSARLGSPAAGKWVGRMQPAGALLRLCFDGGTTPDGIAEWGAPDTVISYLVHDGHLVRWDENAGTTFIVASYVQQMQLDDQGNGVEIQLTFAYRNQSRTYTLMGMDP
jgi:type II secretory pathway pseudopilin PulG